MAIKSKPRTQEARSVAMRARLIRATIDSLVDKGYAATTVVEVCKRAGVTRGALFHHFEDLADLLSAALTTVNTDMLEKSLNADPSINLVDRIWHNVSRRDFKAVIEVWLAARNDPTLASRLGPVIEKFRAIFDPASNDALAAKIGQGEDATGVYRLVVEAMIGMALGRAVTPDSGEMGHEDMVLDQLRALTEQKLRNAPSSS